MKNGEECMEYEGERHEKMGRMECGKRLRSDERNDGEARR